MMRKYRLPSLYEVAQELCRIATQMCRLSGGNSTEFVVSMLAEVEAKMDPQNPDPSSALRSATALNDFGWMAGSTKERVPRERVLFLVLFGLVAKASIGELSASTTVELLTRLLHVVQELAEVAAQDRELQERPEWPALESMLVAAAVVNTALKEKQGWLSAALADLREACRAFCPTEVQSSPAYWICAAAVLVLDNDGGGE